MVGLETARLRLRQWQEADLPAFAALNADPVAMEFMPKLLTGAESESLASRLRDRISEVGWGLWAVEVVGKAPFVGFVGLSVPKFEAHFTPCLEVGWRLAREHWGQGYATEAAEAALAYGFDVLALSEVVSFTAAGNFRSRAVMERLGMSHNPADDFIYPALPAGHALQPHVLYRLTAAA